MAAKEYKRTCKDCGMVWHSLTKREDQLSNDIFANDCHAQCYALEECFTCHMCGEKKRKAKNGLASAGKDELTRLKTCPNCESRAFTQEIIEH